MNAKEILSEVKKIVFGEEEVTEATTTETTVEKFEDATLSDGTLIQIEPAIEVGATAFVEDPNAGIVPLPDGDYELSDGRTITIANGVITAISEPVVQNEEVAQEAEVIEPKQDIEQQVKKIVSTIEKHFNSEIERLENELTEHKSKFEKVNELYISAIEELEKQPIEKPIEKNKAGFAMPKKQRNLSAIDKLIEFRTKK